MASTPRLESMASFVDLDNLAAQMSESHQQLCGIKRQFQIYSSELVKHIEGNQVRQQQVKDTQTQQRIDSIHEVETLQHTGNSPRVSSLQSVGKEQTPSAADKQEALLKALKGEESMLNLRHSLIESVCVVIEELEDECTTRRHEIEEKKIALKKQYIHWNTPTVISWLKTLSECSFNQLDKTGTTDTVGGRSSYFYGGMYVHGMSGRELDVMTPVFLKFMGVLNARDQQVVLDEIEKLKCMAKEESEDVVARCVVCRDNPANYIAWPCAHICVCRSCSKKCKREKPGKCPFCGNAAKFHKTYSHLA